MGLFTNYFKISFRNLLCLFLILITLHCAPTKDDVSDQDLSRVLEYVANQRIASALQTSPDKPTPSDWELFEKSCEIFRLDSKKALLLLSEKNPEMYKSIKASGNVSE
jgi:hypothetical protein